MVNEIVYKYCKANRAQSILSDNNLHFSHPDALNDPLDALVRVDFMGYPIYYKATEFAVLSLSEVRDSQQMWQRYAKNHAGICLGFRTQIYQGTKYFHFQDKKLPSLYGAPKGYLPLYKVKYEQNELHPYQSPGGNPMDIFNFLVHKNPNWEQEKERRVILDQNLIPLFEKLDLEFSPEILEEVIFGKGISGKDQEDILGIIKAKYQQVNLLRVSNTSNEVVTMTNL